MGDARAAAFGQRRHVLTKENRSALRSIAPQRATDSVQAFGEHFRVHAHPDAKMIGHFEEATGNCGRVKFRSQALEKNVSVSVE